MQRESYLQHMEQMLPPRLAEEEGRRFSPTQ